MYRIVSHRRQGGAMIVTAALVLLFMLGFMGIALDFGRLFVIKTELQTAMDSCALAAAQELDGQTDAMVRAASAGMTAGNLNRVDFQSVTWQDNDQIIATDITFRDANYVTTDIPADARYAQCQHTQSGVRMWLLHAMGAFTGTTDMYRNTQDVLALAVATRASAQTSCPLPVALKPKAGGVAPDYGLQIGEWVTVYGDKVPGSGEFGWYNLDGSKSAKTAEDQLLNKSCESSVGDELGTPGAKTSLNETWNFRFGIYKKKNIPPDITQTPDFSGYSYTSNNWKNSVPQNAWSGTPAPGSHTSAANFLTKREQFASYSDTSDDIKVGNEITFGDSRALQQNLEVLTSGTDGQHQQYGASRRVAVAPVIGASNNVIDYVCVFMLHPMNGPQEDVKLEFLGNAADPASPCTTNGLPGGLAGPLVPVLVQ